MDYTVTDSNYKQFTKEGIVIVTFSADWCMPCRALSPILDEIASDYNPAIKVGKLNADENDATTTELGIRSIPTVIIYKDGEIVERAIGSSTKSSLTSLIDKYLN